MTKTSELIGEKIKIIAARSKNLLDVTGTIVDETKFTIVIEHNNRRKTILKNTVCFRIEGLNTIVDGSTITKRPEERVKT